MGEGWSSWGGAREKLHADERRRAVSDCPGLSKTLNPTHRDHNIAPMRLNRPSLANRLGKRFARPLSRIACAGPVYPMIRMVDAYLNFLIGKGSGGDSYLKEEAEGAAACISRP